MTDGIGAGADMITGGLIGRAVEPRGGGAAALRPHDPADPHGHAGACLNCGTTLIGSHCHACGQAAHVHRTAGAFLHDIAHGVFHFEGKAWHTLPMLVLRPGDLTRRYVDGERARFVSPLALFLFTVFLMFAIVANLPGWSFDDAAFMKSGLSTGMVQAREQVAAEAKRTDALIADLTQQIRSARGAGEADRVGLATLEKRLKRAVKERADLADAQRVLPADGIDIANGAPASDDNWIEAKLRHAQENPKLVLYKLKTSAYKYSWALIPLSIPFLWLLFPFHRRYGFYDHAVFTTYSLTFMSLLVIVAALLGQLSIGAKTLSEIACGIALLHIYKQMKGAYRLKRSSALVRTGLLVVMIVAIIVPLFALGLLYLGLA
jgi:hypothetical protein